MIAYRYDTERGNKYVGEQTCQRDPIASMRAGEDIFLLPGDCTYTPPPEPKDGYDIIWNGEVWEYQEAKKKNQLNLNHTCRLWKTKYVSWMASIRATKRS